MTEKHLKKCSRSFITRGMQVKTTLRTHFTQVRMARIERKEEREEGKWMSEEAKMVKNGNRRKQKKKVRR